jgi:hypothetical protein
MKKLILVLLVVFGGVASADAPQPTPQEQACYDLANHDKAFGDSLLRVVDKKIDQEIVQAHQDAFHHIQKNEAHVIYAYAAMWVIAALLLLFLWRRQQGLRGEIAQLKSELAAATKEQA